MNFCERYRGCQRISVLFLMAVLVILTVNREKKQQEEEQKDSRVCPAVFVLSVYTGIAYAFSLLLSKIGKKEGKGRSLSIAVISFLLVITALLSGRRVMSEDHFSPAENALHLRTEHIAVMDRIIKDAGNRQVIRVAGPMDISMIFNVYSSRFAPLYSSDDEKYIASLSKDARAVYEQFKNKEPDMKKVTDALRRSDCTYLVINTDKYYPEFKAAEFGFDLVETVGFYEIYRMPGNTGGDAD